MLADRELMFMDFEFTRINPGHTLLSERSVNIYSDMGDVVREGDIITLTGELVGFGNAEVELQWQFDNGMTWTDVPGANRVTHAFVATAETIDYSWRLSVNVVD